MDDTSRGRSWYRKLTQDWPCALGDWAWWACVVVPADFLNRQTLRKVLHIFAITVLVLAFWQIVGAFDALVFSADLVLYLDVMTPVLLLALKEQIGAAVYEAQRTMRYIMQSAAKNAARWRRFGRRQLHRRRIASQAGRKGGEDREGDGFFGPLPASLQFA